MIKLNEKLLIIRSGEISDISQIKKIDNSLKIAIDNNESFHKSKALKLAINNENVIVCAFNNELIGYIWYEYFWGYIPFISLIRVHKSYHRQGVGGKILSFLEQKLKKDRITRILSSTEVENKVAIKFHQNLGFKECGYFELSQWEPNRELFFEKLLTD